MFEEYNKVQKAVLETTLELISEKELQATSMSLISKVSGISTGSIYHYFNSKEDIINELFKGIVKSQSDEVLEGFDSNEGLEVRFQGVWKNFIKFAMSYSRAFQFIEQYSFSPYITDEVKKKVNEDVWCNEVAKLYSKAIEQKLFIELEPKLMVQMHYGSMVYLLKSYFQGTTDLTDDIIQTAIYACWNAARKKGNEF
ncbi:TetR family transcriptional regulator [Clostridium chromiireducens]|uniref:TetR family transcriptional regulator n=1 Tax=Clostridium chromiireducens TaxID=225345 RepID=A0A964W3S2_9CLOT|nr:TetR/AcrR family transcriptional regulator [Clostridium chromiireducens]MVX65482.1 TetR family transcriptional regulator [Clostridium chromiireducens]